MISALVLVSDPPAETGTWTCTSSFAAPECGKENHGCSQKSHSWLILIPKCARVHHGMRTIMAAAFLASLSDSPLPLYVSSPKVSFTAIQFTQDELLHFSIISYLCDICSKKLRGTDLKHSGSKKPSLIWMAADRLHTKELGINLFWATILERWSFFAIKLFIQLNTRLTLFWLAIVEMRYCDCRSTLSPST